MSSKHQVSDHGEQMTPIPREFAAIMRPELPSLLNEMAAEIVAAIPEYAQLFNGSGAKAIRVGIAQNVATFVDQIAAPSSTTTLRDELCRQFGRFEAYEGRTLDMLQDAYRICCQVALRRARTVGKRYNLSASFMLSFADALFGYMGDLAELSRQGYLQALGELGEEPENRSRRLLRRIVAESSIARGALTELAQHASWPLPNEVTLVALDPDGPPERAALDKDLLLDLADPLPYLLIPGPLDEDRVTSLARALGDRRAAVGLTTPLEQAAHSLRWARLLFELVRSDIVPDRPVPLGTDHLLTLWLLGDRALAEQFSSKYLAPLAGHTPTQRARLVETLRTWLATRGTASQVAEILGVHPQTVRYRLRVLDRIFGELLSDPDNRFATEVALRTNQLAPEA